MHGYFTNSLFVEYLRSLLNWYESLFFMFRTCRGSDESIEKLAIGMRVYQQ